MRYVTFAPLKFRNLEVKPGDTFKVKNEDAIRPLLANGVVKTVRDIIEEQYQEHLRWLKSYFVTDEDIKEHSPELLTAIHSAIEEMDNHFLNENLQGFNEARERFETLYLEAVNKDSLVENIKKKGDD